MDVLKLRLSGKFMRKIVSKLIAKAICKKYGCKVDIRINELDAEILDGETSLKIEMDLKMKSKEFMKLMKSIGED